MEKSQKIPNYSGQVSFWQVVKRILEPVEKLKKRYFLIVFSALIIAGYNFFGAWGTRHATKLIENGDTDGLKSFLVIFAIITVLFFIIRRVQRHLNLVTQTRAFCVTYKKYLRQFIKLDNNYVESIGTGRMFKIIDNALGNRTVMLTKVFSLGASEFFKIILNSILVYVISPYMFLIMLVSLVLATLGLVLVEKKLKWLKLKIKDLFVESGRFFTKVIMSKFEILQTGRIDHEIGKNEKLQKEIEGYAKIDANRKFPFFHITWLVNDVLRIVIFLVIGIAIIKGGYKLSDMIGLITALGLITQSLFALIQNFEDITDRYLFVEKMFDTFDKAKTIDNDSDKKQLVYKSGNIKIQNMSFGYDKSQVFQNFSLQIQGGTKTAFVGESGGGKTTLIKLLAGYIRPDSGEIEIDGQILFSKDVSAKHLSLQSYYKNIGYLTQDPSVFDGTIYENLVYALDTEPPKEDLEKVVKLAKCEFIREFEKGLETEIGERGVRLSGGQKQRLAIAKIMLKNPNIILLDEPTSALDSFNEEQISIALHNLFKGKTVIVVAHRLQTVKQADRILLFEQGKILEEGTHDELVKLGGKYKKMLDLQSGF